MNLFRHESTSFQWQRKVLSSAGYTNERGKLQQVPEIERKVK